MYFVLNVNACIVHFSHENESLRGIQLGPVKARAHCQGALYSAVLTGLSPGLRVRLLVLIRIIITPGAGHLRPALSAGCLARSAPRGHTRGNQPCGDTRAGECNAGVVTSVTRVMRL